MKKKGGKIISDRQLAANKVNAKSSTGPKTAAGKLKASRNATKHGLLTKEIFLEGENNKQMRAEYARILTALRRHYKPDDAVAAMLLERMAVSWWRLARVLRFELRQADNSLQVLATKLLTHEHDGDDSADVLEGITRNPDAYKSQIDQALETLKEWKQKVEADLALDPRFAKNLRQEPGFRNIIINVVEEDPRENGQQPAPSNIARERDQPISIPMSAKLCAEELDRKYWRLQFWKFICNFASRNPALQCALTRPNIPGREVVEHILRYETAIERQFYRAKQELENHLARSRTRTVAR